MDIYKLIILIIGILLIIIPLHILTVGIISYNIIFKRVKKIDFYKVIKNKYFNNHREDLINNYKWYQGLKKERLTITNNRNIELVGYLIKNSKNEDNVVVIYSHGWHSTGSSDIGRMGGSLLYNRGYDILVVDQEAHGESGGEYTSFGVNDGVNIMLWVDKVNEIYNNNCKIILSGMSMGANTLLLISNKYMKNVKLIIADCAFTSLYEEMKYSFIHKLKLGYIRFLEFCLFCYLYKDIDLKDKDARITLKSSKYPILFIQGRIDKVVPTKMVKENYYACTSKKDLVIIDKADHALSSVENKEEYEYRVLKFVMENINS